MSAVVVEIGADATAFQKAVDGLPARMNAASGQMAGAMTKMTGGSNRALGQMAMQVQDIAVQLQMGTKWTMVMAQQLPQMLGAFGAGGAIAGGVVAVGAAFYTMAQNAKDSFNQATQYAETFQASLDRLLASGDSSSLFAGLQQYQKTIAEPAMPENKSDVLSYGEQLYAAFSPTVTRQDLINAKTEKLRLSVEGVAAVEERLVQLSAQQATIAELRASGRQDEANEMERQLKLAQEIAKVQSYDLSGPAKWEIISNLKRQYAPPQQPGGDVFQSVMGSFSKIMPEVIGPVAQVVQQQLNQRAQALNAEAAALRGAAFGGLRGDADTSYGRGHSINPLNNGASRMVSELVRQSTILQQQAKSMDKGNGHLAEIEKAVKKFSPSYQ